MKGKYILLDYGKYSNLLINVYLTKILRPGIQQGKMTVKITTGYFICLFLCLFACIGFEKVRQLTYPGTDIALVCFSIDSLSSFNNVKTKWVPELSHYAPGVPIILVVNSHIICR